MVGEAGRRGFRRRGDARELRPDIVLLDIQLPDVDGVEASRLIEAAERRARRSSWSRAATHPYLAGALAECPACGFIPKSELSGAALRKLVA